MKGELRGRGSNSISDPGHHNILNEGAFYEITGRSLLWEIYPMRCNYEYYLQRAFRIA
jgi:hypothetical protein